MASTNIELTRRVLDEVWNKRNLAVIDELVANDFVFNDPMAPPGASGVEAYRQFVLSNLKAFPDLRLTVDDAIADGETSSRADGTRPPPTRATSRDTQRPAEKFPSPA